MITQSVYRKLRCMSGNPKIIERDDMGRIRSVTSYGVTTGILMDNYFVYFNSVTNLVTRCLFRNVQKPHTFFDNLPDDIHPELRELYLKTVEKIIKLKQNPSYFDCKFYEIRIKKQPEYDIDAPPYYEHRFAIGARNYFYFRNSSGLIEPIRYTPKTITIVQTFEEGELPMGTEHLHKTFLDLTNELDLERQELVSLKSAFPELG